MASLLERGPGPDTWLYLGRKVGELGIEGVWSREVCTRHAERALVIASKDAEFIGTLLAGLLRATPEMAQYLRCGVSIPSKSGDSIQNCRVGLGFRPGGGYPLSLRELKSAPDDDTVHELYYDTAVCVCAWVNDQLSHRYGEWKKSGMDFIPCLIIGLR
ncbi:MAG: hypothetical protein LBJ92_04090 [Holosporales bacterium]|nr:hypothetical protein [Holosporales bacterium]